MKIILGTLAAAFVAGALFVQPAAGGLLVQRVCDPVLALAPTDWGWHQHHYWHRVRLVGSFRVGGGGVEQLLAADPIGADRRLALRRHQPFGKTLRGRELGAGVFLRVQLDHVVAIDQLRIALDRRSRAAPLFLKLSQVPRSDSV